MASQQETDVAALHLFDELKAFKKELFDEANNLGKLVSALHDPVHWRIKSDALAGYGEHNAQDVRLPDLKVLGDKVFEYQQKHHTLTVQLSKLSTAVRETIERELKRL
jgi:phosphoketolase